MMDCAARGGSSIAALGLLLALASAIGCGVEGAGGVEIPGPESLSESRGVLIFDPPRLEIGDVANLELVLVTPPRCRVLPEALPATPGLWVLERRQQVVERGDTRWIHRLGLRVRPREPGRYAWPSLVLTVEDESGERAPVTVEGREFEVSSVVSEFPTREAPFGAQHLGPARTEPWSVALAAALGAFGLALILLLRRFFAGRSLRARPRARLDGEADRASPVDWASGELEAVRVLAARDSRAAASAASTLLRGFVDRRFGTDIRGATTRELAGDPPQWFLRSRWPQLLEILHELDRERFRPTDLSPEQRSQRIFAALENAERFIAESSRSRGGG